MANEKRLIDASLLRSHFLGYVRTPPHFHYGDWQNMCINGKEIDEVIETAPTVDAVEVVRCKDCKHLNVLNRKEIYAHCPKMNTVFLPFELDTRQHFCSCGTRRSTDD